MQITEISVSNLFGIFNHIIPLNLEDRITIVHGPNGFGKTILLKMLDGLFNGRYSELRSIPFTKFRIQFDEGSVIWVDQDTPQSEPEQQSLFVDQSQNKRRKSRYRNGHPTQITISFSQSGRRKTQSFSLDDVIEAQKKRLPYALSVIEDIPDLERVGSREWVHLPTDEILSINDVLERYYYLLPSKLRGESEWWKQIRQSLNIRLIETQRLLNIQNSGKRITRRPSMVPMVEQYAEELAETIQQRLTESAALSQSLDRTFPARLVEQMGHSNLTDDEVREKLSDLEKKRSRLKEVGLLDKEEDMDFLPSEEIVGNTKDVLTVYVQDVEKKLSIFDELANKIDLFKEIISERFLYKNIAFSARDGFAFTTLDKKHLPLTSLSSGEQHELVLLYQLLFKVEPDSLILIDEPELSLHVAWQKQFLKDLQKITKLASFDLLIATHSPQIIHDRWDLTAELEGPAVS